jgi:ferric-dicitrate binding protein FerR (iron transport regulator)
MKEIFDISGEKLPTNEELYQRIINALMDDGISLELREEMQSVVKDYATEEQLGVALARYGEKYRPAYGFKLEGEALASYNKVARRLGLKQIAENLGSIDGNLSDKQNGKKSNLTTGRQIEPLRKQRRLNVLWRVAAVLLPIAMVVGGYFMINNDNREFVIASADYIQHTVLPDSTRMIIEAGSSITYNETDSTRVVALQGDAFFDVKRDTLKPFLVSTGNLRMRVLGTEFRVSESSSTVSLFEGNLAVHAGAESKTLSWGERLTYDRATGGVDVSIIPAKEMMSEGYKPRLIFDHATLGEVLDALAFTFDTEIITAADVNRNEGALTVNFENMSLIQAIEFLIKIDREDLSFSSVDGTINITRNY